MISRREISYIKKAVNSMQITPPEIKPIIANYLIKRARVFDLNHDIILKDIESIKFHLREVSLCESKEYGYEKDDTLAIYKFNEKSIRFFVDKIEDVTPQYLHQIFAHELNHVLNKWAEQVDGIIVADEDMWDSEDPRTGELYSNFQELIVERTSSMTLFPNLERDNPFISNHYIGYFYSGPCLEMAMAAFGISEYEFLKNGIKSKEDLKRYLAKITPFSLNEIDNTFNYFEHFYNLFHNVQFNSKNPRMDSNNIRRENIASGLIGMMNVAEGHIQSEIEKRDLLSDPDIIDMLAYRQNQLRASFETTFNNSLWMYGKVPDSNIRVYNMTINSLTDTSKRIHYLQQFIQNRSLIESIAGNNFENVIEAIKYGNLKLAYSILAKCDKRLDVKKIEEIEDPLEAEKAILIDFESYGIKPIGEDYGLTFNSKVINAFLKKNQPPKMPLAQRIADMISEVNLFSMVNKKRATLGYKRNFFDLPIIKALKNRKPKFMEFPVKDPYENYSAFSYSRYIQLDNMTPEQKNRYIAYELSDMKFQTPELDNAFYSIISERMSNYNMSVIQIEGEIDQLFTHFSSIEFTKEPPKYIIDKDKMVYYQDGRLLINEIRAKEANDPQLLYQELSAVINYVMDLSHNDYLLDDDGYIIHMGYFEYMNDLFGKYEYSKYNKDYRLRLTPAEEKLSSIPQILVQVMGNRSKDHLFDYISVARKGGRYLNNFMYDSNCMTTIFDTERFIEGVDILYSTLNSKYLLENQKSEELVKGCDLLFEATEKYNRFSIANFVNGRDQSLDNFFIMQGYLAQNAVSVSTDLSPDSEFAKYAEDIYDRIITANQGVLYLDKIFESGKMDEEISDAIFALKTGGSTDPTIQQIQIDASEQFGIYDPNIAWKICIVALTGDYSEKSIRGLRLMSAKAIETKAKELLFENGITLPDSKELQDRIAKAYNRSIEYVSEATQDNSGQPIQPNTATFQNRQDANKGINPVMVGLFRSVKEHYCQNLYNIDGKGEPQHFSNQKPKNEEPHIEDGPKEDQTRDE